MGIRSMATIVETSEGIFLIDPGAALAPRRYGLPPHDMELRALKRYLDEIYSYMGQADYVIISHYHRDHYLYRQGEEIHYRNKLLLVKNPVSKINWQQRVRAHLLFEKMSVKNLAKEIRYVDGMEIDIGKVKLKFSAPLSHGDCDSKLGWVLVTSISEEGYVFTHASDIQGCLCNESLNYLVNIDHDVLALSGPPTYIARDKGLALLANLIKLVRVLKPNTTVILDHHILRDREYEKYLETLRKENPEVNILTAAEYIGIDVNQLEAYRDILWRGHLTRANP